MGHQADYSLEVAHEIDEEVRALIEAAHNEAWSVLNTYRDVLDNLVIELLEKETLQRRDLERIFSAVEKRPRITEFNDFGGRTPSDKPPVKTPRELAKERGEPWPEPEDQRTPVGIAPGGNELPGRVGGTGSGGNGNQPYPGGGQTGGPNGYGSYPPPYTGGSGYPGVNGVAGGPPNYGAPPGWTPATTPPGQPWNPNQQPGESGESGEQQGGEQSGPRSSDEQ
jgi:cell division protease FtsH